MEELKLPDQEPDFEAEIEIFTFEQGGRRSPPLNGIRWDLKYKEDNFGDGIHSIWPFFINDENNLVPGSEPLSGKLRAWMYVMLDEMRDYHRNRMKIGQEFTCQEGSKSVAKGVVTRLIRLAE